MYCLVSLLSTNLLVNASDNYNYSSSRYTWPRKNRSSQPLISNVPKYEYPNKRLSSENNMLKVTNPLGIEDGTSSLPGLRFSASRNITNDRTIDLLNEDGVNLLELAESEPELMNFIRVLQNSTLPLLDDYVDYTREDNMDYMRDNEFDTTRLTGDDKQHMKGLGMTEWDDLLPRAFDFGISTIPPMFYLEQAMLKLDERLNGLSFESMRCKVRILDYATKLASSMSSGYLLGYGSAAHNSSIYQDEILGKIFELSVMNVLVVNKRGELAKTNTKSFIDHKNQMMIGIYTEAQEVSSNQLALWNEEKLGLNQERANIIKDLRHNYEQNFSLATKIYQECHEAQLVLNDNWLNTVRLDQELQRDLYRKRFNENIAFQSINVEANSDLLIVQDSLEDTRRNTYKELEFWNKFINQKLSRIVNIRTKPMLNSIDTLNARRVINRADRRDNLMVLSSSSKQELTNNSMRSWTMKHDIIRNNRYLQKTALAMI